MSEPKSDKETQLWLEEMFHKNKTLRRIRKEFDREEFEVWAEDKGIPYRFALDLLAQMVLLKRATVGTLIGVLHKHFLMDGVSVEEACESCSEALEIAMEMDIVDWDGRDERFIIKHDVAQSVYDDLERFQYPLPMVVKPEKVTHNKETGYLTHRESILLSGNYHEDDVCLDHINKVNAVPLAIDMETARLIQNQWKNLDKQKSGEPLTKYQKRVKAFKKYTRSARDVLEHLFILGNHFYLTHRYDTRGRCYSQGYHVNPQGNDWNKAVIQFANKEKLNG